MARTIRAELMPPSKLECIMWVGAVRHAIGDTEAVTAYREATGDNWTPGSGALEKMIDEATGRDLVFVESFIEWFNANIWGPWQIAPDTDHPPHEED